MDHGNGKPNAKLSYFLFVCQGLNQLDYLISLLSNPCNSGLTHAYIQISVLLKSNDWACSICCSSLR